MGSSFLDEEDMVSEISFNLSSLRGDSERCRNDGTGGGTQPAGNARELPCLAALGGSSSNAKLRGTAALDPSSINGGMRFSESASGLDHDDGAFGWNVLASERNDTASPTAIDGPEVEDQDLIFGVIDQGMKLAVKRRALAVGQVTAEDGVLEMVAMAPQRLIDGGTAVVVDDIVRDDEAISHGHLVANGG